MKKKVLYGVFLTALACASMGTLQSCKDDLADLRQEVNYDRESLRAELARVKAELQGQITNNANDIADLKDRVKNLEDNYATKDELNQAIEDLKAVVATKAALEDAVARIKTLEDMINDPETGINAINAQLVALRTDLNTLGEDFENYKLEVTSQFEEVYMQMEANMEYVTMMWNVVNDRLDGVDADLAEIWESLDNHSDLIASLIQDVNDLKADLDERFAAVNEELALMNTDINALWEKTEQLEAMDNKLVADIVKTNNRIDEFFNYLNKMVSGILIQGTYNPLFGDFSLPMGIQSNMLFNWHGRNDGDDFFFPNATNEPAYNGAAPAVTDAELAAALQALGLPIAGETINNGLIFDDDNFGFGTLYTTVNPVNADFENTAFSLETSAGKKLPFKVVLEESDEELSFGYSRETRAKENGFYAAKVNFEKLSDNDLWSAVESVRIEIDENVKAAAKAFYQDRTKRNALEILKALYNSMNGFMPRYALRYDWTSVMDGKTYENAVLSKYELGIATAKPLSYAFAEGVSISHKLPTFGNLQNVFNNLLGDRDKYTITLPRLSNGDITIPSCNISFSLGDDFMNNAEIKIDLSGVTVNGESLDQPDITVNAEDMADLINSIKEGIDAASSNMNAELNTYLQEELANEIVNQVNDLVAEYEGKINDKIQSVLDAFNSRIDKSRLMGAVNKVIDIYNRCAGQLNRMLANPNAYLQPAMFYEGNGRVNVVSTRLSDPTVFAAAGGDSFNIYASSYSAEIFAPAYKKFVACTGVYNPDGSAPKAKIDYAGNFNKDNVFSNDPNVRKGFFGILPGGFKRIVVNAENMEPGLVYEITYQGVDYHGKTSTQKFYITKK